MLTTPYEVGDATQKAVVELALQYRIMTDYTSFVAVDELRIVAPDGEIRTVVQPLPIPAGTTYEGFGEGAYGVGGLGLVGTGRGGGGTGSGTIGIGNTGLIGKGGGGGSGSGYGRGGGEGFGGRGARVPQVRQAAPTVTGSLDKDIIRRIVRAHINEVRSCYNAALANDPNLAGNVTIEMTIGADGKLSTSLVTGNTTKDEPLAQCIAKAAQKWTFPKPAGGGTVTVSYPFVLSPG
jgi:Ca-activated chloride channel family protein